MNDIDPNAYACPISQEQAHALLEFTKAHEQWEVDLLMKNEAWTSQKPAIVTIHQDLWDRMMQLQEMRNTALGRRK